MWGLRWCATCCNACVGKRSPTQSLMFFCALDSRLCWRGPKKLPSLTYALREYLPWCTVYNFVCQATSVSNNEKVSTRSAPTSALVKKIDVQCVKYFRKCCLGKNARIFIKPRLQHHIDLWKIILAFAPRAPRKQRSMRHMPSPSAKFLDE